MAWLTGLVVLVLLLRGLLPWDAVPFLPLPWLTAALVVLGFVGAFRCRRAPAGAPPWRDPAVHVLVVALAVATHAFLAQDERLTSDGVDHFVYLRSVMEDGDLDLANDYARLSPRGGSVEPPTPLGRTANVHPVGPALLWAPFYVLAELVCLVTGRPTDGFGYPYRTAAGLASILYGWLGLVVLQRVAAERVGRGAALAASLATLLATFLWFYLAFAPTMAHAPEFLAAALFVACWLKPTPRSWKLAALLGATCGLAALLRWSSVLVALLPVVSDLPRLGRREEWPRIAREAAVAATFALLVFSPQMLAWKLLYGEWLTIPQGTAFVSGGPAWAGVLFSPRHGLFSWSPVLYLGVLGLLVGWWRRDAWRLLAAVVFFLALTRVNAGTADWWGGAAFGGRRFDATLPLFGLGLAFFAAWGARVARRRPLLLPAGLLAAFVLWNLALAEQFRSGAWDYSEPVAFEDMAGGVAAAVDRRVGSPFALPASLLDWLRTGRSPADWESLYMERRFSRWAVRGGVDDRLFLEDGWSGPVEQAGATARFVVNDGAGFVVPLHRAHDAVFGARLLAPAGGTRVRLIVNQRPVGGWDVGPAWADHELDIPADALVPGRNNLRLKVSGPVAVGGMWLRPRAAGGTPSNAPSVVPSSGEPESIKR